VKILWVKAGKLLPVDTGGKIRSLNLLRQLAARHEVTVFSYYGGRRDAEYEREIAEILPGARTLCTGIPDSTPLERSIQYLLRLPSPEPFAVSKFGGRHVRRLVSRWIAAREFDVAVCDFLSASRNFPQKLATPTVLFAHNVESALWSRQASAEEHPIKRLAYEIEARKMQLFERRTVARFDHVIAVSENDRAALAQFTDATRVTVVPTGVDLRQFQTIAGVEANNPSVVFLGSMDWEPNIGGVEWFCAQVWPRVVAAVPAARFRIVGRAPHPRVRRLASANVEVTGAVPSVLPYLAEAAVFVVPLHVGGGTRLKIFEAMAAGRSIVSTSLGAEGLDVTHGRDILLADDPASFASEVIRVLTEPQLRRALSIGAGALAAEYDWSSVVAQFETVLAALVTPPESSHVPNGVAVAESAVS
jgi:sugar transferase (PEP-CTERM/EpsH1 system associated)